MADRIEYSLGGRRLITWQRPGDGPPLVMLPGVGGNGLQFADLAEALAGRWVIAIDPPGVGDSQPSPSGHLGRTVDELAALAADAFGAPAVWIGQSWGGLVSAMLAGRAPELAALVVLIDPSPAGELDLDDEALAQFATSIWDGRGGPWSSRDEAITDLRGRRQYATWTPNVEASLRANLVGAEGSVTTRATFDDVYAEADATLRVDYSRDVAGLRCPTLYLVASESRWWQALSNDDVLPAHVDRVEIEGQHLLHLDQPARVAGEISRFLAANGL